VAVSALLGYWALLMLVPVSGAGAGVLTPAGNLASYIDRLALRGHLLTPVYDPEGVLSTLPAIATALGGVFAGDWLKESGQAHRTLILWTAGLAATIAGLLWGRVLPINKNLWTSSFALFTAGVAAQVLACCHWIVDVRGWRSWSKPFVALGRNPLAGYFLSIGFDSLLTRWSLGSGASLKGFLYRSLFASSLSRCCGAETASAAYALAYVALWAIVLGEMHRRRVYIAI